MRRRGCHSFLDNRPTGGSVNVSFTCRQPFTPPSPQKISGTHFLSFHDFTETWTLSKESFYLIKNLLTILTLSDIHVYFEVSRTYAVYIIVGERSLSVCYLLRMGFGGGGGGKLRL